jgi:hypothetical protein|tara:strand:+ start:1656 stop:1943 length:288 start_codon:yes stop_codon:yes gene_type:complete
MNAYQQVVKTLAEDTQGNDRLLRIALQDLVANVKAYKPQPEPEPQPETPLDLVDSVVVRCTEAIDSLDDEGLAELGAILLGEEDADVIQLKAQIQ